ncbi:Putative Protein similar to YPL264C of Saccharomyces cerevisiae [Podospora comata]|uniref:EamA domain-containing protein n=1 Tax=Podospora comata TaxID=48703 RepID=A0ABY6SFP0_PODCO|nr:Putative Protein similar to YPL264C of Saccharomyces cerevisiae [Podospora comata]
MSRYLNVTSKQSEQSDDDDVIDNLPMEVVATVKVRTSSPYLTTNIQGLRSRSVSPNPQRGALSSSPSRRAPAPASPRSPTLSREKQKQSAFSRSCLAFWEKNKGPILVVFAQLFGALMNVSARLLELEGDGMHPLQILFVRMSVTSILSCIYMYWKNIPDFPMGPRNIRPLLLLRGFSGFFGIYGMWYSMMYLPLAEATVITFLAPCVAGYICHLLLKDPFTRKEQIASFIALGGVVLIAKPTSLFSSSTDSPPPSSGEGSHHPPGDNATPTQRLFAILVALLGVLGAAGAYSTIRWIGKRTHPLITVNYFSVFSTIVSTTALLVCPLLDIGQPAIRFGFPSSGYQWFLLGSLGICGFGLQFLLTAGLAGEKSNRATAMVYTHMLFAAGFDRWVFGHTMGLWSVMGCALILGGAMWAALGKKKVEGTGSKEQDVEGGGANSREEGVPMLNGEDTSSGDEEGSMEMDRLRSR